jgi:hypothetical protein
MPRKVQAVVQNSDNRDFGFAVLAIKNNVPAAPSAVRYVKRPIIGADLIARPTSWNVRAVAECG